MVHTLLSIVPSLRLTIKEVFNHPWLNDSQLKEEIAILEGSVELNPQNNQDENLIQVIEGTPRIAEVPLPLVEDNGKKRKLPFSVPPFFAAKRFKK